MGLFSGKAAICQKCGKEFTKGLLSGEKLCAECAKAEANTRMVQESIKTRQEGIKRYYEWMPKGYKKLPADISDIIASRTRILQKYMLPDVLTDNDIEEAMRNTAAWTDEQKTNFMMRAKNALVPSMMYVSFTNNLIMPNEFPGVVVDTDDVFAVCISENTSIAKETLTLGYTCCLFTNDPYFPVTGLNIVPVGDSLWEMAFSHKKRTDPLETVLAFITPMFRNLTYPIMTYKDFKKTMKNETQIRGNINPDLMKLLIKDVSLPSNIFSASLFKQASMERAMGFYIKNFGYRRYEDIFDLLFFDKTIGKVWSYYAEKCEIPIR